MDTGESLLRHGLGTAAVKLAEALCVDFTFAESALLSLLANAFTHSDGSPSTTLLASTLTSSHLPTSSTHADWPSAWSQSCNEAKTRKCQRRQFLRSFSSDSLICERVLYDAVSAFVFRHSAAIPWARARPAADRAARRSPRLDGSRVKKKVGEMSLKSALSNAKEGRRDITCDCGRLRCDMGFLSLWTASTEPVHSTQIGSKRMRRTFYRESRTTEPKFK